MMNLLEGSDEQDDANTVRLVTIEGGIGVGKSTVMEALRKARPSLLFIDEPVKEWRESGLLQAMYDKSIPLGTFQIAALATRMAPLLKAIRDGHRVIVTERCPYSDYAVFTKANLAAGSVELTAYKMAYDALLTAMPKNVHLCNIYLEASVDTLMARMQHRDRAAERMASEEAFASRRAYLSTLQELHEQFYTSSAEDIGVTAHIPTRINANETPEMVARKAEWALSRVLPVKLEPLEPLDPRC